MYDREEAQVLALENTLRALQQNILAWIEEGEGRGEGTG